MISAAQSEAGDRQLLAALVQALEVGDWRRVLDADRSQFTTHGSTTDSARLAHVLVMAQIVARSMRLQVEGRVSDAWDQLGTVASLLPADLRRAVHGEAVPVACLTPRPRSARAYEELTWKIACLVWREQSELADLRRRLGVGSTVPRDGLIEAGVQHLLWVEYDPFTWHPASLPSPSREVDGAVDISRSALCRRATRLRRFADPSAGDMGHSVWRDLGGYPGLRAEALIRLANRATPAPWTGVAGTFGLTMRRGRLRAWQYARAWIEDIQASNSAPAYIEDSVLPKYAVRRSGLLSEGISEAPESRLNLDAGLQEVRTKILREEVAKMLARNGFDPADMLGNGLELEAGLTEVRANLARSRGTP